MTINANTAGHNVTIGAGGLLEPVLFDPLSVADIWSWAWAGEAEANITKGTSAEGDTIDEIVNLASPGTNDFLADGTGAAREGRPLYEAAGGLVGGTYTTPYVPLAIAQGSASQWLTQTTSMGATGEFYIIFACWLERSAGNRHFVGIDEDGVEVGSTNGRVTLHINNVEVVLTVGTGGPAVDGCIIEVWRDASNNLHCWVDNVDSTDGSPSDTGVYDFNGYGGKGAAADALDDYLFELISYSSLPTESERTALRSLLNQKWDLI